MHPIEEQNTLFSIADLIQIPEARESKFSFEYQELCSEMEPYFGKLIWTLPHKVGFTENKLRRAFEVCKKYNKMILPYLIVVIKNDKGL